MAMGATTSTHQARFTTAYEPISRTSRSECLSRSMGRSVTLSVPHVRTVAGSPGRLRRSEQAEKRGSCALALTPVVLGVVDALVILAGSRVLGEVPIQGGEEVIDRERGNRGARPCRQVLEREPEDGPAG